jgi:hypothetical protein
MDARPELERKQRALREAVRGVRGLTLRPTTPDQRAGGDPGAGDRRLADVVNAPIAAGPASAWEDQLPWTSGRLPSNPAASIPKATCTRCRSAPGSPGTTSMSASVRASSRGNCGGRCRLAPPRPAARRRATRAPDERGGGGGRNEAPAVSRLRGGLRPARNASARLDSLRRLEALAPAGQEGSGPSGSAPTAPALQTGGAVVSEDLAPVAPAASAGGSERHRDPERRRPPRRGGPSTRGACATASWRHGAARAPRPHP